MWNLTFGRCWFSLLQGPVRFHVHWWEGKWGLGFQVTLGVSVCWLDLDTSEDRGSNTHQGEPDQLPCVAVFSAGPKADFGFPFGLLLKTNQKGGGATLKKQQAQSSEGPVSICRCLGVAPKRMLLHTTNVGVPLLCSCPRVPRHLEPLVLGIAVSEPLIMGTIQRRSTWL